MPTSNWDIVGGPGHKPERPNPADYEPGGRYYNVVAYSVAQQHYQQALDAYQRGYWYHGNSDNYTTQQLNRNNSYVTHTGGFSSYGVHTSFGGMPPAAAAGRGGGGGHGGGGHGGGRGRTHGGGSGGRPTTGGGNGNGGGRGRGGGGGGNGGGRGGHGGHGGGNGGGGNQPPAAPDPFNQGAFDAMYQLLDEYGLSELSGYLKQLILSGTTDSASLQLALQQTDAWKRRFAGNEMLRQKGLAVLSPAEYLATERQYAQIMSNYGLPQGFYDDPTDFAKFIGNSISVNELQQRVSSYSDLAKREDPAIVAQLNSMGLSQGDLLAYMIDPTKAAPLIQQTYQTALIGGAARRAGVVGDNAYLTHLADIGVTEQQASQGYGLIAGSLADAKTLSSVYGVQYGQHDMETEMFDNNAQAGKTRKRLASQERAAFSGSAGVGKLTGNDAGSY